MLAVDGACGRVQGLGVLEQRVELELGAVEPWAASFARATLRLRDIGDRIGLYPADQVVVLSEQSSDDFASGIAP